MKPTVQKTTPQVHTTGISRRNTNGFALVVTLSLMILLTIIAVGLLSLSSIALRSSGTGAAQAQASSNAKLALMLAIGDLQRSLGPDTRVSANAGVLETSGVNIEEGLEQIAGAWEASRPSPENIGDYNDKKKGQSAADVAIGTDGLPHGDLHDSRGLRVLRQPPSSGGHA